MKCAPNAQQLPNSLSILAAVAHLHADIISSAMGILSLDVQRVISNGQLFRMF
jgi:hypothetical protein